MDFLDYIDYQINIERLLKTLGLKHFQTPADSSSYHVTFPPCNFSSRITAKDAFIYVEYCSDSHVPLSAIPNGQFCVFDKTFEGDFVQCLDKHPAKRHY